MRPTIARPDLGEITRRFDLALDGASSCPGDRPSLKRVRILKRLILTTYVDLVNMEDDNVTPSDWAWAMRVVVETCLRDIMQLGLIRHIYDLVFSVYCGGTGAPMAKARIAKFSPQFGQYQTTFKDAYLITCKNFQLFGLDEAKLKAFCANHDQDTALEIVLRDIENPRPLLKDKEARETIEQIKIHFWDELRKTYFKLKNDGRETYDFDIVFENEDPPFPNYVFMSLAAGFFGAHGWLPVGDNVGLFKDKNMTLDVRRRSPGVLARMQDMFNHHGNVPAEWQVWWKTMAMTTRVMMTVTMHTRENGIFNLATPIQPHEKVQELVVMFPGAKALSPPVQLFVAHHLHLANTLNSNVLLHIGDYNRDREGMYDEHEPDERGASIRTDLHTCFSEMAKINFGLDKYTLDDQSISEDVVPDYRESGKMAALPFQELIDHIRKASMFTFLRELLTIYNPEHVNKGLFLQACVDYANKHDPEDWHDGDDDWTLWFVTDHPHPLLIRDKRLFSSSLPLDRKEVSVHGRIYDVTEKGQVCYAYNRHGEGMYAIGYFCKDSAANMLSSDSYLRLRGAYVTRDHDHSLMALPLLKSQVTMGGEEKLFWKGHGIGRTDLKYWQEQLGPVSASSLRRYQNVIRGLPPYVWL
ncbi:hypothetical protein CJU90_0711 [Yarrowia sp. C11]|nr:hypothetical protein CKK34_2123 [Yarrowia sp. E02]KAG5373044.1 hypothetical protein CJU90_0711 [Yarrowia sp. C11]